jgi:crotonobetaine/carnitine-CoA ligase
MLETSALPGIFAPTDRTLPKMLDQQAGRHGHRRLFKTGTTEWTVSESRDIAARSAGSLAASGIRQGDRVALMCSNRAEFMQIFLGCAWLGAIIVPINVASKGAQLQHILSNSGAVLLVIEVEFVPALAHIDLPALPLKDVWLIGDAPPAVVPAYAHRMLPPLGETAPAGAIGPGDTLAILYTSGTTGPAKGVCCPHAQYFWWGVNTSELLGIGADDVLMTTLPLFHTNALNAFYQALLTGALLVVEPRFSVRAYWTSLATHGATVAYLLGAMVPMLMSREPSPADRAHKTRVALAPGVPGHLHAPFAARFGIGLIDGFGSTETNFTIGAPLADQRPGWMGPVFRGFEARVVDADDNEVPDGEAGELLLRATEPFAFATGYFGMPEKTIEAWRNLWFHTGDRVIRNTDGYFKFVDRLKDAIRRRGENISSFEVEQVLLSHPAIATAAAFPVRSDLAEDEVMAAIVLRPGATLTPVELMTFCQPRMAYFAIPRYVEFLHDLPATENGKIQKYKLRERGITPNAWDREAAGYKLIR